jgi:hypothetical protein
MICGQGLKRLDEGGPGRRRSGSVPRRTPAHVDSHLANTARAAASVERLLRGTFSSGQLMVDAQTRMVGICPARAPDVPPTALNSHASRHHMAGSCSVNAAQDMAKDELVVKRSSVRFRQAAQTRPRSS